MALEAAYKSENFGPSAPHVVLKHVGSGLHTHTANAPYGVWVCMDDSGRVRPVGSGCGIKTLEEAIRAADRFNETMNGEYEPFPSPH